MIGTLLFWIGDLGEKDTDQYLITGDSSLLLLQNSKYRVFHDKPPYYWSSFSTDPEEWL